LVAILAVVPDDPVLRAQLSQRLLKRLQGGFLAVYGEATIGKDRYLQDRGVGAVGTL